jgi:hypothetical protein
VLPRRRVPFTTVLLRREFSFTIVLLTRMVAPHYSAKGGGIPVTIVLLRRRVPNKIVPLRRREPDPFFYWEERIPVSVALLILQLSWEEVSSSLLYCKGVWIPILSTEKKGSQWL